MNILFDLDFLISVYLLQLYIHLGCVFFDLASLEPFMGDAGGSDGSRHVLLGVPSALCRPPQWISLLSDIQTFAVPHPGPFEFRDTWTVELDLVVNRLSVQSAQCWLLDGPQSFLEWIENRLPVYGSNQHLCR